MLRANRQTSLASPWTFRPVIIDNDERPQDDWLISRPLRSTGSAYLSDGANVLVSFDLTLPRDWPAWPNSDVADHRVKFFTLHSEGGQGNAVRAYLDGDRFQFQITDTTDGNTVVSSGPSLTPGTYRIDITGKLTRPDASGIGFVDFKVDGTRALKRMAHTVWPMESDPYMLLGLDARRNMYPPGIDILACQFDVWAVRP